MPVSGAFGSAATAAAAAAAAAAQNPQGHTAGSFKQKLNVFDVPGVANVFTRFGVFLVVFIRF